MPKKKTNKAAAKRFSKTKRGKLTFHRAGRGHLLSSKSRKRKRGLRRKGVINAPDQLRISNMLA